MKFSIHPMHAKTAAALLKAAPVALVSAGLLITAPGLAAVAAPTLPPSQPEASKAFQGQVDKQAADAAAERRKKLLVDAAEAIA